MSNKDKYLEALDRLKKFSDDTSDSEVDETLEELDRYWYLLTDAEKDAINTESSPLDF